MLKADTYVPAQAFLPGKECDMPAGLLCTAAAGLYLSETKC